MHTISAMVFIDRFVYDIKEQLSQSRVQISTKRRFITEKHAPFDIKVTINCSREPHSNVIPSRDYSLTIGSATFSLANSNYSYTRIPTQPFVCRIKFHINFSLSTVNNLYRRQSPSHMHAAVLEQESLIFFSARSKQTFQRHSARHDEPALSELLIHRIFPQA